MRKYPGGRWDLERSSSSSSLGSMGPRAILRPKTPAEAVLYDYKFAFPLDQDLRRKTPYEVILASRSREENKNAIASSIVAAETIMLRDSVRAAVTPKLPGLRPGSRPGSRQSLGGRSGRSPAPSRREAGSPMPSGAVLEGLQQGTGSPARRKSLAMIELEATKLDRFQMKKREAEIKRRAAAEEERRRREAAAAAAAAEEEAERGARRPLSLGALAGLLEEEGEAAPQRTRRKAYTDAERIREDGLVQRLGEALRKGDHVLFIRLWDDATWLAEVPERVEFIKDAARRAAGLKERDEF
eukprot:tig00000017_g3.t1